MMKQYWPGVASGFLFLIVPPVMRHTGFKEYITAYMYILLALEVLLFVTVLVARHIRRKAQQTMP